MPQVKHFITLFLESENGDVSLQAVKTISLSFRLLVGDELKLGLPNPFGETFIVKSVMADLREDAVLVMSYVKAFENIVGVIERLEGGGYYVEGSVRGIRAPSGKSVLTGDELKQTIFRRQDFVDGLGKKYK